MWNEFICHKPKSNQSINPHYEILDAHANIHICTTINISCTYKTNICRPKSIRPNINIWYFNEYHWSTMMYVNGRATTMATVVLPTHTLFTLTSWCWKLNPQFPTTSINWSRMYQNFGLSQTYPIIGLVVHKWLCAPITFAQ